MTFNSVAFSKTLPALKHGGYAATILLPGENPAAFEQLHGELIAEHGPNGALEEDIVATIAGLVWRKQNLGTLRIAQLARSRFEEIRSVAPFTSFSLSEEGARAREEEARAKEQAQKELGDTYHLAEIGDAASFFQLARDLSVQERLDGMIDKCLKRLLFVRGLKSISPASSPKKQALIEAPTIAP